MKNRTRNVIHIVILMTMVSVTGAFAQADGGGRLEGTWDATVTITNCSTGNPMASFFSIANFMQGGTSIGSTAGMPQSLRTPEHGVWSHVKGNSYRFKFKTFSFNAAGAPTGWTIVAHDLELDQGNNSYTSAGTARFFAPDGTQTGQGCSSAVGTRMTLD